MEYVQDKGFRERLGAVTNRTYRTWRPAKLTHIVRLGNHIYRIRVKPDRKWKLNGSAFSIGIVAIWRILRYN